jgi:hypothetical protein
MALVPMALVPMALVPMALVPIENSFRTQPVRQRRWRCDQRLQLRSQIRPL